VSLLSELIAQLTALIEQNRRTEAEIQGARDTADGAVAAVQAATVDSSNRSSNRASASGLPRWRNSTKPARSWPPAIDP
jgi:hypothetical protein